MKAIAVSLLASLACVGPLVAQEKDRSLERIAVALQQPHSLIRGIDPVETAKPRTVGIFTLVRPELHGEFVRVSVPIGELLSRAFRGISEANKRRQEEAARRRVEADLKWFAAQHALTKP